MGVPTIQQTTFKYHEKRKEKVEHRDFQFQTLISCSEKVFRNLNLFLCSWLTVDDRTIIFPGIYDLDKNTARSLRLHFPPHGQQMGTPPLVPSRRCHGVGPTPDEMGYCDSVTVQHMGGKPVTVFFETPPVNSRLQVTEDGRYVYGGDSVEMALSV